MAGPWQFWNQLPDDVLVGGAALAVLLGLLLVVIMVLLLRRRGGRPDRKEPDLRIDLGSLPDHGPPPAGPRLEFYGTPVRLAVLVLAPAGRNSPLPSEEELSDLIDDLVPGLWAVVEAHNPLVRCWPFQLSTQGFTHAFFKHVQLPGDRGKGTPWSAVAGRFETGTRQLLAGLVCVADRPNSLSQITVAHMGQWLDVLRIRNLVEES
jgi:hypothetical protein